MLYRLHVEPNLARQRPYNTKHTKLEGVYYMDTRTFVSTKGTLTARAAVSFRACLVGLWLSPTAMRTWELCVRRESQEKQSTKCRL